MIKVEILDDDLRELILCGVNAGKYKRIARDKKFVINNRVERLLFRETETGLEITLIELNDDHYGNKK